MKHSTFSLLMVAGLLALSCPASAEPDPELQRKLDEKLAKPFVAAGGWIADYDLARERAQKEGKLIFAYFTRSYAT